MYLNALHKLIDVELKYTSSCITFDKANDLYNEEVKRIVYEVLPEDFEKIRIATGLGVIAFGKTVGLSRDMVYKIEGGQSLPSLQTLQRIMDVHDVHFNLSPNSKHPLLKQDAPAAE